MDPPCDRVEPKASTRIVIVGGGVAGLSLANMLERAGIDFVVLEAYEKIAPQLGASIAIYPQFARILDQIGCWQVLSFIPILQLCGRSTDSFLRNVLGDSLKETVNHVFYRNQKGEAIFSFYGLSDGLERRHGYPVIFIERQILLRALYDNLGQKEKVLVKKRLVSIQTHEDGVQAFTQDGCSYAGDIVIGADGMHSSVRKAMHQLGKSISPGTFDRDEYSKVQCSYKCIFGMSRLTPGIKPSTNHLVLGNGHSYLILAGSEKVYWFLNAKNTRVMYGKEIPRYTAEDERRLAEEHFGDRLNEQDTFKDVYENKIMATLTPLHEYQWKRWYFQRIMTIGDASHKLNPISGNGGSAAVEDAAALFSVLQRKLGQSQVRLSTRDFQDIFAETQHVQETRTRHLISHATKMQEFDAMQSLFSPLLAKFVIPHLTDDAMLALVGDNTTQARCIESFQVPRRPRYVPYEDELPADILKDVWIVRVFIVLWYLVYFLYSVTPQYFIHPTYIMKCIHAASQWHSSIPTIASGKTNSLAFEISLFPMIFIWNVEGYRRGNRRTIGSRHVAIFFSAVLAASRKAGVVPLYFILAACNSSRTRYTSPAGRPLPVSAARAVLTGTFMVYGVSLFFIGLQLYTTIPAAYIASVFQWQPLVIAVIIWGLANANKVSDHHAELEPDRTHMGAYLDKDYPYLTQLYLVLFAFGATANIYVPALADDERLVTIMVCSHCLHSVFEMRRLGYIPTRDARNVMLAILFALQFIGPGALFAATWAWRERLIYRLSRGHWAVGE